MQYIDCVENSIKKAREESARIAKLCVSHYFSHFLIVTSNKQTSQNCKLNYKTDWWQRNDKLDERKDRDDRKKKQWRSMAKLEREIYFQLTFFIHNLKQTKFSYNVDLILPIGVKLNFFQIKDKCQHIFSHILSFFGIVCDASAFCFFGKCKQRSQLRRIVVKWEKRGTHCLTKFKPDFYFSLFAYLLVGNLQADAKPLTSYEKYRRKAGLAC